MSDVLDHTVATTPDRAIVIARVLDAPRELVFDAWTDPDHVAHWWGPDGFTITTLEMKVAPGGVWRFIMHGPRRHRLPQPDRVHRGDAAGALGLPPHRRRGCRSGPVPHHRDVRGAQRQKPS
jgi:hypothetical protein